MEVPAWYFKDFITAVLVTAVLSVWLYWLWSRRDLYRFALSFPGHFGLPVIGSFSVIKNFKNILQVLNVLFVRCKSYTICMWFGLYPNIFSADPEFIEKVLLSSELLDKNKRLYIPLYQALQGGIIASPASVWKRHRKAINPAFHYKVLLSFLPVFHKAKNDLFHKFDKMVDNGGYKLNEMMQVFALGISFETTMGNTGRNSDKTNREPIAAFRFIMEKIIFHIMLASINIEPLFMFYLKYQNAKKQCYDIVKELLEEKFKKVYNAAKTQIQTNEDSTDSSVTKTPSIFIDHAIANYQKNIFSLNDVVAESNNILAASFETTANGIHSVLLMLATHPDVQERLFEEIVNVFPEKDFEMGYEHFDQLPYLDMVINETLRLAPSIPIIGRQVLKNTELSKDLTLPKGLGIMLSIYHVHRRKDIWGPNADSFNPDNFLPENIAGRHPYAFIPFSKGARNCVGWRYALFALKVILAGVVRNFRFTTSTKYEDIKFVFHVALKYLNEPLISIHRRE